MFSVEEAISLWKQQYSVTSGPFEEIHSMAYRMFNFWPSWGYNSKVLRGYFEHTAGEIEVATRSSSTLETSWNQTMFLELSAHALSALMLRENIEDIPVDHLPLREDTEYISRVWCIVKNVYARGDTIPTDEEYRMLCEAIPSY